MSRILAETHADVRCVTYDNVSVFHLAAEYGHVMIMKVLVDHAIRVCGKEGVNELLHSGDSDGKTPLHLAVWGDPKPDMVTLLLDLGTNVNVESAYHYTPLHWAAKHGHVESARVLLHKGADSTLTNSNGDTAMDLALRWGQDDVARMLIDPTREICDNNAAGPSPITGDVEGCHYRQFETAFEEGDGFEQMFRLQKLADVFCGKGMFFHSAHVLNAAYVIAKESNIDILRLIVSKLERIEGEFLYDRFGIKTSSHQRGHVSGRRRALSVIRNASRVSVRDGQPIGVIQQEMNESFQLILCVVISEAMEEFGVTPPHFAVFSLGSMAREEMCPYSDVEFGFLIQDGSDDNKKYFRNLSQFIQLKIINLGETKFSIIRPKRINGSNDLEEGSVTPSGFSMDIGGLCPMGREGIFELIGTPSELAKFQTAEWFERNEAEVILVNAMTRPAFLMGERSLFVEYEHLVHSILNQPFRSVAETSLYSIHIRHQRAIELMKGYVTEFEPRLDEDRIQLRGFDVKRELYRLPHCVVNALSLYYDIPHTNTLQQLRGLTIKNVFSSEGSERLRRLLMQAMEWRVETHLFYGSEKEIMYSSQGEGDDSAKGLFHITDEIRGILRECFRTLYPLHSALKLFIEGDTTAFSNSSLYDDIIGTIVKYEDDPSRYREAAKEYIQSAALNPESLEALDNLQRIKRTLGEANGALEYSMQRLAILEKNLASEDCAEEIADCKNSIGMCLGELGRHEEALIYQMESLELQKSIFGNQHPRVASYLGSVGVTLGELGRHQEAFYYQKEALELRRSLFDDGHPHVVASLHILGMTLGELGRHEEALIYQKEALELYRSNLGEHPYVAASLCNVGGTLGELGRHEEALVYEKEALELSKRIFGDRHPDVAGSLNNVGVTLRQLGRFEEALIYQMESLELSKRIFGDRHPDVAGSLDNLGGTLGELGRHEEALTYLKEALELRKSIFGDRHPSFAISLNNTGRALRELGRCEEALTYLKEALEILKSIFGDRHPNVASIIHNVGITFGKLGRHEEALIYLKEALELRKSIFGDRHPDVARSLSNVGSTLGELGRHEEALLYQKEALEIQSSKISSS